MDCPSGRREEPVGEILGLVERIGLALRADVDRCIFALGGKGMASGDGDVTVVMEKKLSTEALDGDCGHGDSGDLGDGVGDLEVMRWKVGPREGELESERRRDRIAAVGS